MNWEEHYRALENMYAAAPINDYYKASIHVDKGTVELAMEARGAFHHGGGAVHGAVYFKMLDDAAFFAANSREPERLFVTTAFTTYFTRPLAAGRMRAVGMVVNEQRTQIIAEAVLYDAQDRELARGSGIFVRGKWPLADVASYAAE